MHDYLLIHALRIGMQKQASQQKPANKTLIKSNNTFALYKAYEFLKDSFMVLKIAAKIVLWKPKVNQFSQKWWIEDKFKRLDWVSAARQQYDYWTSEQHTYRILRNSICRPANIEICFWRT